MVQITAKLKKIENYETNRKIKTEEVLGWSQSLSKNFLGEFVYLPGLQTNRDF